MEENNNKENIISDYNTDRIDNKQKIIMGFLFVMVALILFLWLLGMQNRIKAPFNKETSKKSKLNLNVDNSAMIDTDKDGLSDSDELNIYNTSPYLEDSDSDGFSDYEEVKSGHNPNCPVGSSCDNPIIDNTDNQQEDNTNNKINKTKPIKDEEVLSGKLNAQSLRKMLLEAGMNEEFLNQISDKELIETYKELLSNK